MRRLVTLESLDMNRISRASRYGRGSDYLNCPMTMREYYDFVRALVSAETAPLHEFETVNVFEGCMPVEVMAKRGDLTLAYGPLKPVGLAECTASDGKKPFAVVQLRQDNSEGTLFNIVGFQTNLRFGEQKRVFGMIPGLANAEYVRYGVMHRNSFLQSPKHLTPFYSLREREDLFFAGQLTGVEGYVESASSGLAAGINLARLVNNRPQIDFTRRTAIGALAHYVSEYNGFKNLYRCITALYFKFCKYKVPAYECEFRHYGNLAGCAARQTPPFRGTFAACAANG